MTAYCYGVAFFPLEFIESAHDTQRRLSHTTINEPIGIIDTAASGKQIHMTIYTHA